MAAADGATSWSEPIPFDIRDQLNSRLDSEVSALIVIRSPTPEVGTAILHQIVHERPWPAVMVVASREGVGNEYPRPPLTRVELLWRVLPTDNESASIAAVSAAMQAIHAALWGPEAEPAHLHRWLPLPLLEAYGMLPVGPMPTVAVDSWDDLLATHRGSRSAPESKTQSEEDIERAVLRSLKTCLGVHFFVIARRPRPVLDDEADVILDAMEPTGDSSGIAMVRVVGQSRSDWTVRFPYRESPILRSKTSVAEKCRCGSRIPAGGEVLHVTATESSEPLFRHQVFCSMSCIRAFCLESLETLEALDTPASNALVTDLRAFHRGIAEMLALILDK
jgi:hypothetical protein